MCRHELKKTVQACQTLTTLAQELSQIHLQRQFNNIVILGGVEKALMAMKKVISLLRKHIDGGLL